MGEYRMLRKSLCALPQIDESVVVHNKYKSWTGLDGQGRWVEHRKNPSRHKSTLTLKVASSSDVDGDGGRCVG